MSRFAKFALLAGLLLLSSFAGGWGLGASLDNPAYGAGVVAITWCLVGACAFFLVRAAVRDWRRMVARERAELEREIRRHEGETHA